MNLHKVRFIKSAALESQFPETEMSEIAFVGRSNVGKSSLINALLNRKSLCKVGSTPGMTRLINFFLIDEQMYMVDLPGYGFARVSRGEKGSWEKTIENYLTKRQQLKRLFLLLDVRHKPSKEDQIMVSFLEAFEVPYTFIVTKADKLSKMQVQKQLSMIRQSFKSTSKIPIFVVSSMTKQGISELMQAILQEQEFGWAKDAISS